MTQRWPRRIWIVRHGESLGNVARQAAQRNGLANIDIAERDVDVPLSPLGERQSVALARWFAAMEPDDRPNLLISSPYRRALQTADLIRAGGGLHAKTPPTLMDERLREKEFGILDRLTAAGVAEKYPDQTEFRRLLGKFYHRPPAGESWCDIILRLRSAFDTISLHHSEQRVLIVAHEVVVFCMRYLLENLTEAEILAIDARGDVVNCGVTEYAFDPDGDGHRGLVLERFNFAAPLEQGGAEITSAPDIAVAAR